MAGDSNAGATSDSDLNRLFQSRFGEFCATGSILLRAFAQTRPTDFSFLLPSDLSKHTNFAFAGIAEWDEIAEHLALCKQCHV